MHLFKINHIKAFQMYQVLKYASSILLGILLTKSYLPVSDLGQYELFVLYSSVVSFFWVNGLSQGLLINSPQINQHKKVNSDYFNAFVVFISTSTITVLIFLTINNLFTENLLNFHTNHVYTLLYIYHIINPPTFLIELVLLLEKRHKELVLYSIITLLLPPLLISLPAFAGLSLEYCFCGLVLWTFAKFVYLWYLLNKYSLFKLDKGFITKLSIFSAPLIITALLAGSSGYIDSLIVNFRFDDKTFAIFKYGAKEFPIFLLIANSFGNSMIAEFSNNEMLSANLTEIKKQSTKMIHFSFTCALIMLIISQFLFSKVFNNDFYESYKVFDIYLLLVISRFVFPQTVLMGLKRKNILLKTGIAEFVINLTSSLVLSKYFGFLGVAYGTLIAYFFEKTVLIIHLYSKHHISPQKYIALKELSIYSFILLTCYLVKQLIYFT